jgi:hypothetical protein
MNTKYFTYHQGRAGWSALIVTTFTLFFAACSQSPLPLSNDARTYDVRGIVRDAPNSADELALWWLTHAKLWFAIIAMTWTAGLLLLTGRRVGRVEA